MPERSAVMRLQTEWNVGSLSPYKAGRPAAQPGSFLSWTPRVMEFSSRLEVGFGFYS